MTEQPEGQPTLAEPKKTVRRKSGKPRSHKTEEAPVSEAAPDGATAIENAPAPPTPAPVPAPEPPAAQAPLRQPSPPRPDDEQIEDAAQILSRITSAPLSAAETARENNSRLAPRAQAPYDRRDRQERGDRQERPERAERERNEPQDFEETPQASESGSGAERAEPKEEAAIFSEGIVEVSGKGFGFLRDPKRNFVQSPTDVFVTPEVVRRFALRDGHWIKGEVRRGSRGLQMFRLTSINGDEPTDYGNFPLFEELTVISPNERFRLETVPDRYTTRIMDLMTPIGKGQRGLIVAPPRTGKTTLLQHIADAIVRNHHETVLIILLVDERPEEVTEIRRTVPTAEIMASSNDMDLKSHTRIAQLAIERAKRLVEAGKDVFVLLDSITRVGRAFNNAMGGGGRTMSGGIDARALEIPRKLFAAARNTEEAGSLTIVATALIETGSRMDELIFQEFKGTGNMEMVLDRKISDLRVYPAIDIFKSGTRREELLVPADQLHKINVIRRGLAGHKPEEAIERLLSFVKKFPTNYQMLKEIPG
jgi:transcription termination factor Rho